MPRVEKEEAQEVELGRCELQSVSRTSDLVQPLIELHVGEAQGLVVVGFAMCAAQNDTRARHEFGNRERLGDVVITAKCEAGDLVLQ